MDEKANSDEGKVSGNEDDGFLIDIDVINDLSDNELETTRLNVEIY